MLIIFNSLILPLKYRIITLTPAIGPRCLALGALCLWFPRRHQSDGQCYFAFQSFIYEPLSLFQEEESQLQWYEWCSLLRATSDLQPHRVLLTGDIQAFVAAIWHTADGDLCKTENPPDWTMNGSVRTTHFYCFGLFTLQKTNPIARNKLDRPLWIFSTTCWWLLVVPGWPSNDRCWRWLFLEEVESSLIQ